MILYYSIYHLPSMKISSFRYRFQKKKKKFDNHPSCMACNEQKNATKHQFNIWLVAYIKVN